MLNLRTYENTFGMTSDGHFDRAETWRQEKLISLSLSLSFLKNLLALHGFLASELQRKLQKFDI